MCLPVVMGDWDMESSCTPESLSYNSLTCDKSHGRVQPWIVRVLSQQMERNRKLPDSTFPTPAAPARPPAQNTDTC